MASNYLGMSVMIESSPGIVTKAGAGVSVKIRKDGAGSDAAESPLTTDSNGEIAAGSLSAISAGSLVYFRVENSGGLAGSIAQITT